MSGSINSLIPELQPFARALVDLAAQSGLVPQVTSTRRTRAEQTRLYQNYLEGRSRYPAAPPGSSAHEYGYAFDMVVNDESMLPSLGAIWLASGGEWQASDAIHFQYPGFSPATANAIIPSSFAEDVVSLPGPAAFSFAQLIVQVWPGLNPDIVNAVLHPWLGLDSIVPQPLLDLRYKLLGI